MIINSTKQLRSTIRNMFTISGGYPCFFICADGGVLCHACAKQEYKQISNAVRHPDTDTQWQVLAVEINWETRTLFCDHCNKLIKSAYGGV